MDEAQHDLEVHRRLADAARAQDLAAVEEVARSLDTQYRDGPGDRYSTVMAAIADVMASIESANPADRAARVHDYASRGLERVDEAPIDVAVRLLLRTREAAATLGIGERRSEADRRRWAERWLAVWQRLDEEERHAARAAAEGTLNVAPPPEARALPGSDPASIDDERLRAQYDASIARNQEALETLSRRQRLLPLVPEFLAHAEAEVIAAYSFPSIDLDAVQRAIDRSIGDEATRQRIVRAVRGAR